jgi:hypothetical protein
MTIPVTAHAAKISFIQAPLAHFMYNYAFLAVFAAIFPIILPFLLIFIHFRVYIKPPISKILIADLSKSCLLVMY